ncbi:MAG: conjugal transfer protein TraN, partial [Proteobacteria bacterium]|nr:conjugal transfer protein TraN [Pseudomonadota bacterium]
ITHNSFESFSFSYPYVNIGSMRWMGQNCSGYIYELKFNITDLNAVETLRINQISVDDQANFYVNDRFVYRFPDWNGCELYGTRHNHPNFDLKPYLKVGENAIKVRFVVGGGGNFSGKLEFRYKACKKYASNEWQETCDDIGSKEDSCIETQKICNSSNESRNIGQGVSETHDCWDYSLVKNCQPTQLINYCDELANKTSCSQSSSKCLEEADKECINYQNNYKCSDNSAVASNKVIYEGYKQDILSEYVDYSNCDSFNNSKYCAFSSETCLDDPSLSTKNIEGLDIVRDCWDYQRNYSCLSEDEANSDCQNLESNDSCTYSSQTCLAYNNALCIINQKSYNCLESSSDIQLCAAPVNCEGENCDDISYVKDVNFARSVASLSMLEDASQEIDHDDLSTFSGNNNRCGKDLLNYSDCCDMSGWGSDISGALDDATETMSPGGKTILLPVLSTDLASQGLSGLVQCDAEENQLALKRQARQCVYIGTYCSEEEDLTGTCLKEKESYCCFTSKLVRIIHEQGRPQLGIGWGSPEAPNCSGLKIDDLDNIDFSQIDFSEIAVEAESNVNGNIPSNAEIATQVEQAISDYYGGVNE